ncbi:hypothetical protein J8L70_07990 [Pseudoalteromonas sp. MMG010]|uniref:flavin reductase family protein n=1 Tax=Pseudoalteromonas sp. MMG010 TaxID=2822685 RepID=UPI001B39E636|nr:FAD-binding oxidoreductase [Pseudoalteromonas sp. MMG010]MBQ4833178.1 hypothetical protein [Pseudoalteromonas sp. MMG010]
MITSALNTFSQWFLHHESFAGYIEPIIQTIKPSYRAGYYRAQVKNIQLKPDDYLQLELKPQRGWSGFIAGQHLNLTVEMNGRLLTRVFTIASSVADYKINGCIRLLIKTTAHTRFTSQLITYLAKGDWCNISPAMGGFVFKPSAQPVVFIAAGSGITPIIAMLKQHLANVSEKTKLVYYAKVNMHQLVTELQQLAQLHTHFSYVLLTRNDASDITSDINISEKPDIYCCGPNGFMDVVRVFATKHQLTYYQEAFGLTLPPIEDENIFSLQIGALTHQVSSTEPLLNQFEKQNIAAKRGCGIGICHQCQCVKKSGIVRNLKTGELSDNGEQLIQLCISQPLSDLEIKA